MNVAADQLRAALDPVGKQLPGPVAQALTALHTIPTRPPAAGDGRPDALAAAVASYVDACGSGRAPEAEQIDVSGVLDAARRYETASAVREVVRAARAHAERRLVDAVASHRNETIRVIQREHRKLATRLFELSAQLDPALTDEVAAQLPGDQRARYAEVGALAVRLESLREAVITVSGEPRSDATRLAWDNAGWVASRWTMDIWSPAHSTRDGVAGTVNWWRKVSRPGGLPVDSVWAPTPAEQTRRAEELARPHALTPQQAAEADKARSRLARAERAARSGPA
jgi:hypothetical protein